MVAVATGSWVARALGIGWLHAVVLVASAGAILAATLTPGADAPYGYGRTCDLSLLSLPPISRLLSNIEDSLNILLFVPFGFAVGALPRSRAKAVLVVVAVASPFLIEGTQLIATPLARKCQSSDVIENVTGLIVGLILAGFVRLTADFVRRTRRQRTTRLQER